MNDLAIRTTDQLQENINIIQQTMKAVMKNGIHYGTIPGTTKPTLFKAGAEIIMSVFRFVPTYNVEDLSTDDFIRYRVTTTISTPGGEVVGTGVGECSTYEEKYAWRKAVCVEEFEATPATKRRVAYKKGKTGAYTVQQIATNPHDLANTCLKMGKKRSMIDALLSATAASDLFSQDTEDLPKEYTSQYSDKPSAGKSYRNSVSEKQNDVTKTNQEEPQVTKDNPEEPPLPEEPPIPEEPKKPGRPKKQPSSEELAAKLFKKIEEFCFGDTVQMNTTCLDVTAWKGKGLELSELEGATPGRLFHSIKKMDDFLDSQKQNDAPFME